ncbi:MAG: M23 family metallopeptidase [Ruminococcaceae bacterium]|nr:M23 family metallopeptidase [Oscillospiraceae bacterium]
MKNSVKSLGKFYIILTVILALVGVFTFIFARRGTAGKISNVTEVSETVYRSTTAVSFYEPTQAGENITGIEDERYASEAETEPETTDIQRSSEFYLPMGNRIVKDYSGGELVFSNTMEDWRTHNGIDFGAEKGTEVVAVNNGIVTRVYDNSLYGTVVEIDHGEGMTAKYCSLDPEGYVVAEGARVTAGQTIGMLGTLPIESADPDHLHFEISIKGQTVDPIEAMGKTRNDLR